VEVRTIDAVDTGERRAYGPLVARHVVTTTTVEREEIVPRRCGRWRRPGRGSGSGRGGADPAEPRQTFYELATGANR
jgi:hypothetical protein